MFRVLLRARWRNNLLEVYWRLALNGLPTAERMALAAARCACGASIPGLVRHYWECPLASGLRQELEQVLAGAGAPGLRLRRDQLWLARVPRVPPGRPALHPPLWAVVCLAALCAMDYSRRSMQRPGGARAPPGGARRTPAPQPLSLEERLAQLRGALRARFWDLLVDFATAANYPRGWADAVASWEAPSSHPFFGADDGSRLSVHAPAG